MAKRKSRSTKPPGNGAPSAPGLAGSTKRRASGLDAAVALDTGVPALVLNAPAAITRATAKRLATIGAQPVAISALVNQRKADFSARKRKADAANRAAKLKAAGITHHTGADLSPRVLAMIAANAAETRAASLRPLLARQLAGGV